jgi:hypothetical protein
MYHDESYLRKALEAGASGFVTKHSAVTDLKNAINAVLMGDTYISPCLAKGTPKNTKPHSDMAAALPYSLPYHPRRTFQVPAEEHSTEPEAGNVRGIREFLAERMGAGPRLDTFVARENVQRYKRMLETAETTTERQVITRLLAEEENRLRSTLG